LHKTAGALSKARIKVNILSRSDHFSCCFSLPFFVNLNLNVLAPKAAFMDNLLLKYMEYRFRETLKPGMGKQYPFITISREFGCPSKLIATLLADELNARPGKKEGPKWQYINKEVVAEAAKELDLEPQKIRHLFNAEQIGMLDDLLSSFSANYKSTYQIKRTINEVIKGFSERGNIILVGRAGVAITQGKPHALHIRLMAPDDWRVECISRHMGIPKPEATSLVLDMDKKRTALIQLFLGRKPEPTLYDLIFNCKSLKNEEIVHAIIKLMETRKLI
jgi:cytidylate kinase